MSEVFDKPVRDIMTRPVVTVLSSEPVVTAVRKMVSHDIGAVIVVSGEVPVGIITERDVLKRVILERRDPQNTSCQEIMSKPLITVRPETPLGEALSVMKRSGIRRLPVVEQGKLIGIVTEKDIIREIL